LSKEKGEVSDHHGVAHNFSKHNNRDNGNHAEAEFAYGFLKCTEENFYFDSLEKCSNDGGKKEKTSRCCEPLDCDSMLSHWKKENKGELLEKCGGIEPCNEDKKEQDAIATHCTSSRRQFVLDTRKVEENSSSDNTQ